MNNPFLIVKDYGKEAARQMIEELDRNFSLYKFSMVKGRNDDYYKVYGAQKLRIKTKVTSADVIKHAYEFELASMGEKKFQNPGVMRIGSRVVVTLLDEVQL